MKPKKVAVTITGTLDDETGKGCLGIVVADGGWLLKDPKLVRLTEPVRLMSRGFLRVGEDWEEQESENADYQLWVYRNKMVEVEGASSSSRNEVAVHVKHAVLTGGQELANLQREIELFEKLEGGNTGRREAIPEPVSAPVSPPWRIDGGGSSSHSKACVIHGRPLGVALGVLRLRQPGLATVRNGCRFRGSQRNTNGRRTVHQTSRKHRRTQLDHHADSPGGQGVAGSNPVIPTN